MSKLTKKEKAYNKWWLSRFDKDYKTIRLFNGNQLLQEYTTANNRYTDLEDARSALMVAGWIRLPVTSIKVDESVFVVRNGNVSEIKEK